MTRDLDDLTDGELYTLAKRIGFIFAEVRGRCGIGYPRMDELTDNEVLAMQYVDHEMLRRGKRFEGFVELKLIGRVFAERI